MIMWEFVYTNANIGNKTKTEAIKEMVCSWTVTE